MAAERGNVDAIFNFVMMYFQGDGVSMDPRRAVEYLEIAAEGGDVEATCNLGEMYLQRRDMCKRCLFRVLAQWATSNVPSWRHG